MVTGGKREVKPLQKVAPLFFEPPNDVILVDSKGVIEEQRADLTVWKRMLGSVTNKKRVRGTLDDALKGADVVIGLSTGGKLTPRHISHMNKNPIVFALSNPVPEIMPDDAKRGGAALVATGRSDFPNQINNALVFPGLFRGLLDSRAPHVTADMKYAVAHTLTEYLTPTKTNILPRVLDKRIHQKIAQAVEKSIK